MNLPFISSFNKIKQLAILSPFLSYPHMCETDSVLLTAGPQTQPELGCKTTSAAPGQCPLPPQQSSQPPPPEWAVPVCLRAQDSLLGLHLLSGTSLHKVTFTNHVDMVSLSSSLNSKSNLLPLFPSSGLQGPQTQAFQKASRKNLSSPISGNSFCIDVHTSSSCLLPSFQIAVQLL